jgi:hypothetical protein
MQNCNAAEFCPHVITTRRIRPLCQTGHFLFKEYLSLAAPPSMAAFCHTIHRSLLPRQSPPWMRRCRKELHVEPESHIHRRFHQNLHDLGGRFLFGHEYNIPWVAELARKLRHSPARYADEVDMFELGLADVSGIVGRLSAMLTNIRWTGLHRVAQMTAFARSPSACFAHSSFFFSHVVLLNFRGLNIFPVQPGHRPKQPHRARGS